MAARTIATTDTLETLRTQFNALSSTDFGDIGDLTASLTATTVIGAVNEIFNTAAAAGGYVMTDGSNSQTVASGQTVTFSGTSNEIEATVSATDTLTIGLPNAVAITTSLTIGGVAVPTISSTSTLTNKTLTTPIVNAGAQLKNGATSAGFLEFFEDSDNGTNKVTLIGPASTGDVTLTLPSATDTLVGKATTDTLTNKTLTTPTITTPVVNAGLQLKNAATSAGFIEFFEDSDNGTNKVTLIGPASTADVTVTLPAAADTLVGKATTDTLTNKSIDLDANTLSGTLAEFNTALQSASFVSLAGAETLTNKVLTTPTLTTPIANAGVQLKNGATSAGFLEFFEDSDNGTNKVTLIGPASTADITLTLPTQAGTVVVSNTDDGNDVQLDSLGLNTAASGTAGELRATDDITAFYSSDFALKENIYNIPSASEKIEQLNGVLFDWKQDFIDSKGGEDGYFVRKTDVGVIAQDVEKVLPEVVATRENGIKAVKYDRLVALLIEGFKEMKQEINKLKKKSI